MHARNVIFVRNFVIFFLLLTMCLGSLGYYIYRTNKELDLSDNWVFHSQSIIIESQELIASIQAMVASQRGYLLSGNQKYLDAFEEHKNAASQQIALLADKTNNNPSQQTRLNELQQNVLLLDKGLSEVIESYDALKSDIILFEESKSNANVRSNILRIAHNILEEEYSLLRMRAEALEKRTKQYHYTLLIGGIVAASLLLILNGFLLQAQSRRNEAEQSLREVEERLQLAIKAANDGIFDWDLKTQTMYWSPRYKSMLGYGADEIESSIETFNKLVHPEDKDDVWQAYDEYVRGDQPEFSHIFRMKKKDGVYIWINARGKAIYNEDGDVVRFVGTHSDVTEIKEYELQLEQAKDMAEKANEAKGEFLAHMSHEIRTPLTTISGVVEILDQYSHEFDDKKRKLIDTLGSSSSSLKDLITDILDFSKIESGEIDIKNESFLLDELFAQVISITAVRATEKRLDYTFNYDSVSGAQFYGDKARLRQILINLIGNAVKFTDEGFVKVQVDIVSQDEGNLLKISVEDSGIGIAEKSHGEIFEKFRQADASVSRRYGGTGLGLPISKNLAELMGGSISLESNPGKGSIFTVWLPMPVVGSSEDDKAVPQKNFVEDSTPLKSLKGDGRILLVEDYEGNIVVLGHILESLGYEYDVARTGVEAIDAWGSKPYDLILMDVQMPEKDGLSATREIRALEDEHGYKPTPIVGLTAHALVADKEKCIDSGMNDYLSKPIDEKTLTKIILKYTKKKQPDDDFQAA